jgi:hypothetical protein
VNIGTTAESGGTADTGEGPTTCYELSYHYDAATTTWQPSLSPACTLESVDGPAAPEDQENALADGDDDWFRDKDKNRSFDDLIIGSITIGVGGPTIGGTGIVGGRGNTAGGTTVGFGGNTAGGTTVGGFGNTVNNSGTTINGAAAAADLAGVNAAADLPTCAPATATTTSEPASAEIGQGSTGYERGYADGWDARGRQDGKDLDSWSWDDGPSSDSDGAGEPVL